MHLDRLVEAVDNILGYMEHPPAALTGADRVVLVDRSDEVPAESKFPIVDWHRHGPALLREALERWATDGGAVRLSGSALAGRGTAITTISAGRRARYQAYAWYAANSNGQAIWPTTTQETR